MCTDKMRDLVRTKSEKTIHANIADTLLSAFIDDLDGAQDWKDNLDERQRVITSRSRRAPSSSQSQLCQPSQQQRQPFAGGSSKAPESIDYSECQSSYQNQLTSLYPTTLLISIRYLFAIPLSTT